MPFVGLDTTFDSGLLVMAEKISISCIGCSRNYMMCRMWSYLTKSFDGVTNFLPESPRNTCATIECCDCS